MARGQRAHLRLNSDEADILRAANVRGFGRNSFCKKIAVEVA